MIAGGGAAGFFAAARVLKQHPQARVLILEQGREPLGKVRISGGGRCNLTHACYEPREMVKAYPRGGKALRGAFHRFFTTDTIHWFEARGVETKTEDDGRIFPVTDDSLTVVNCLRRAADGAELRLSAGLTAFHPENGGWSLTLTKGETLRSRMLLLAPGSSGKVWEQLGNLGVDIVPPVPSLFTFRIPDKALWALSGLSVPRARLRISGTKLDEQGPLLVTHWGLSGPAVLRLSAWGARDLHALDYNFELRVAWTGETNEEKVFGQLREMRDSRAKKTLGGMGWEPLPARLYQYLLRRAELPAEQKLADTPDKGFRRLAAEICNGSFGITGKSTFKEEFVTAGGIALNEVDFRSMELKAHPGLFAAGEVLDIDGITGGYNFQAAWTTAAIAADAISEKIN